MAEFRNFRPSCYSMRYPAKSFVSTDRKDFHDKGCHQGRSEIQQLQLHCRLDQKILSTQVLNILILAWFGNNQNASLGLCLLAPTNNQTEQNLDNAWLADAGDWRPLVKTRGATRSNAWCTLSNTSFYTFGGGNEGQFILDLTIGKPFQSHEMNYFIICSYQNIENNEKQLYNHRVKNDRSKTCERFLWCCT